MRRDKPKDAYDVVWLTDALGPDQAAEAIAASPLLAGCQVSAQAYCGHELARPPGLGLT